MVNAHGIVRSDRPVQETEHFVSPVLFTQLVKAIVFLPKPHDVVLQIYEAVFF